MEYDVLISDLEGLERDLKLARSQAPQLPQSASFYADLVTSFQDLDQQINVLFSERRTALDILLKAIEAKKIKAFTPVIVPIITDNAPALLKCGDDVASLIARHNERSQAFDQTREEAFSKLEEHCASQFALDNDYAAKQKEIADLKTIEHEKKIKRSELARQIENLDSELSEAVKGAETINQLMQAYFGKNDLRITVCDDNRFQITRNGALAKNLSEGERSAVAFVHFITRLLDGKHPLAETTVIVDDPVCSLDANHLFNTYSFVKTKLAGCYQLFVLTHNYEFYSLVKEWALDDEKFNKDKPQTTWKHWSIYLVRRKDDGTSTIESIPPELLKYKSEYHYLFSILYRFQNTTSANYDYLFSLPNVTRRFMEAFGGIMIPTYQGLRSKLPRLIPDAVQRERVWKFINDYSHNNSLNRSLTIPDVSECKVVVDACLKAVKAWNETYFNDLVESV